MRTLPVWVLVADAQHGRILQRRAANEAWAELPEEAIELRNPRTHELGTDRPGRVFDSLGGNRHGIEPRRDLHDAAEEEFARTLAERLEQAAEQRRYGQLLLVAPPRFLGSLRKAIGERTRAALRGTIDKDLTHSPLAEIVQHLPDHRPA